MSVQSRKNQYLGINAHLHSLLQSQGGWSNFHARHIVHLADALTEQLLPLGYIANVEDSLQIRRLGESTGHIRADVLVRDFASAHPPVTPAVIDRKTEFMPVIELFAEEELSETPYRAVAVYPLDDRSRDPMVWIELLSPSNKGSTDDAMAYRRKRLDLLSAGLVFIEIDYLNESPPTFQKLHHAIPDAYPYRIIMIDPHPNFLDGQAQVEEFNVDAPIPTLNITLKADTSIMFDFGLPYHKTFIDGAFGYSIDYAELPLNFDRYNQTDQPRIARRMLAVLEAKTQGVDLETGPFEVRMLDLDDTLAQIEVLKSR